MPLLNGLVMAIGGLGAVVVGSPLSWLLAWTDWRTVSTGLAALTLAMAVLLWFGVPDARRAGKETFAEQLRGTRLILVSEKFWRGGAADAAEPGHLPGRADALGQRVHARCAGAGAVRGGAAGIGDRLRHDGGMRRRGLGRPATWNGAASASTRSPASG